jgi:membrane protein DedA with SNARE-associated domain
MNPATISPNTLALIIIIAALWTIPWKGVALWKSAKNGQKTWFIIILVVNLLAIVEIIYIFFFSKKNQDQTDRYNQR